MNLKQIFNATQTLNNNGPKIIFDDQELEVAVGKWLRILSLKQVSTNFKSNEISKKFGHLLALAGFDKLETCTLNQYDKDNNTFNCYFNNSDTNAKMSIRWGNFIDFGAELIIDYLNNKRVFEYFEEDEQNPARLELQECTIKNVNNDNTCKRIFFQSSASFLLENKKNSLILKVKKPDNIKKSRLSDYVFNLKNEEELQRYLLNLTFPIDINDVYKKICEISIDSIKEYPKFHLELKNKISENQSETTDIISIRNGLLKNFVITRDDKKVKIDSNGNWTYTTPKLAVSKETNGNINYSLKSISDNEIVKILSQEKYDEINHEVEKVKALTKTIGSK